MAEETDIRVSADLHPQVVTSLDDYDEDTQGVLGQVETAFSEAYQGIGQVFTAREKSKTNPTWNEAMQIIHTQDFADKVFARAAGRFDKVSANLKSGIKAAEEELSQPVQARAAHTVAVEIRNYVRALPSDKLHGFIHDAIDGGDTDTVSAILGAPAYLSGLTPEFQQVYLRKHHERQNPVTAKRVRAMKAALELVGQRSGLLFSQLEKAVGVPPHKVQALRKARTAAEQAFVLKDL